MQPMCRDAVALRYLRFLVKIFVLLVLAYVLLLGSAQEICAAQSQLIVTVHDCSESPDAIPQLTRSATANGQFRDVGVELQKAGERTYRAVLPEPGERLWLKAFVGRCYAVAPVSILPGHSRSISLFTTSSRVPAIGETSWVAGCIAPSVQSVLLASDSYRGLYAAAIEDGCYYFDLVGNGKFILRFQTSPGYLIDIPVVLSTERQSAIVNLADPHF
jgi:hypothetical protein